MEPLRMEKIKAVPESKKKVCGLKLNLILIVMEYFDS